MKNILKGMNFYGKDDYFAISVSESQIGHVIAYIKNQEQHHATNPFEDEINQLNEKFGIKAIKDLHSSVG